MHVANWGSNHSGSKSKLEPGSVTESQSITVQGKAHQGREPLFPLPTLRPVRSAVCLQMRGNNHRPGNGDLAECDQKRTWHGSTMLRWPTKFEGDPMCCYVQMRGNHLASQRRGDGRNSAKRPKVDQT